MLKQVQIGSHAFTFDYVFGSAGLSSSRIFDECVAPLVDALFHGYNGTVLAYGQVWNLFLILRYFLQFNVLLFVFPYLVQNLFHVKDWLWKNIHYGN